MKIAIFHNLPSGGAKRAVFEWTTRLRERHNIDVYTLSSADTSFCDIKPFSNWHCVYEFDPSRLFRSPFGRINQLQRWRDLRRLQVLYREMAAQIDSEKYDVVFSHGCKFTFIPILLSYLNTPSLYYLHEHFPNLANRAVARPYSKKSALRLWVDKIDPFLNLYYRELIKLQTASVKATSKLLANSEFTREQFSADFGIDTVVSPLGVNTSTFIPIHDLQKEKHVLSVGELSPIKGFDFLIKSLSQIQKEQRPILRLACNNQNLAERNYLVKLAEERDVSLEILMNLSTEQMAVEYNRASLCIYAPIKEPFGLVPLEAMACGTPVLGVQEGGITESVIDGLTGYLTPRDEPLFAEKLQKMLADPGDLLRLGKNARDHVLANWSWEQSTEKIERHLSEVANS